MLSTVLWAAALPIGGLWFLLAADSARYAVPVVAIAVVVGFTWQQSRARARRRKAALDAYAQREIARAAASSGQRHFIRRPLSAAALSKR